MWSSSPSSRTSTDGAELIAERFGRSRPPLKKNLRQAEKTAAPREVEEPPAAREPSSRLSKGALEPATPIRLAELLDYAPGAVVSRTLAKSGAGTLTVFAFDEGEELSEHTSPFDAYLQVLDGRAELTIGAETLFPEAGETVRMPADVPHAVKAIERFKMLLILIRD
jgi:quercetin dioxygenase-like cupin family protein